MPLRASVGSIHGQSPTAAGLALHAPRSQGCSPGPVVGSPRCVPGGGGAWSVVSAAPRGAELAVGGTSEWAHRPSCSQPCRGVLSPAATGLFSLPLPRSHIAPSHGAETLRCKERPFGGPALRHRCPHGGRRWHRMAVATGGSGDTHVVRQAGWAAGGAWPGLFLLHAGSCPWQKGRCVYCPWLVAAGCVLSRVAVPPL